MRLHVGVLGAEERLRPLNGERFGYVDEFAAAVVPAPGVALRVLVGEYRPERLEHRGADEVLRGDQLQTGVLAVDFVAHGAGDLGVDLGGGSQPIGAGRFQCVRHSALPVLHD